MRRRLLVPGTLGAVGSWNPPVSFSFSPWSRVSAPLVGRPSAFRLTTLAPSSLTLFCSCSWHFGPYLSSDWTLAVFQRPSTLPSSSSRDALLLRHVFSSAPSFVAGRLASCSQALGAFGFHPCLWPFRGSPRTFIDRASRLHVTCG